MGSSVNKELERIEISENSDCYLQDNKLKVLNPRLRWFDMDHLYCFDFGDDIREECLDILSELDADLVIYLRDNIIVKIEYKDCIIESKLIG